MRWRWKDVECCRTGRWSSLVIPPAATTITTRSHVTCVTDSMSSWRTTRARRSVPTEQTRWTTCILIIRPLFVHMYRLLVVLWELKLSTNVCFFWVTSMHIRDKPKATCSASSVWPWNNLVAQGKSQSTSENPTAHKHFLCSPLLVKTICLSSAVLT